MQPADIEPRKGRVFIGIAAASLATGPTLVLLAVCYWSWTRLGGPGTGDLGSWFSLLFFSALICLIGSIPAACLNAILLAFGARRGLDMIWWATGSGSAIGVLVAFLLFGLGSAEDFKRFTVLWFGTTGALMGALHWYFAIRPRRHWRLSLLHDEELIRAME